MDAKMVLGLLVALAAGPGRAAGVSVRTDSSGGTPAQEQRDRFSFSYAVQQQSRSGDPRRLAPMQAGPQNGLLFGAYPVLDADDGASILDDPVSRFAAAVRRDGAALFVRAPPEAASPGSVPVAVLPGTALPSYAHPGLRIAYATPFVAWGPRRDHHATTLFLVPGPPPIPALPKSPIAIPVPHQPEAGVVSVSVQNAQGETLPTPTAPSAGAQEAPPDETDGGAESSRTVPAPHQTPAPVFEQRPTAAPEGALVQVVEQASSPRPEHTTPAPRGDGADGASKGVSQYRHRQPDHPQLLHLNEPPLPLFTALGHLGTGSGPIFLIGHPQVAPPRAFSPAPRGFSVPESHIASAPAYTSTIYTTFSSPFVSYSY